MYKGDFLIGEFEQQADPIYDPDSTTTVNGAFVRTAFANNQIPLSRFSATSQSIIPYAQASRQTGQGWSGHVRLR